MATVEVFKRVSSKGRVTILMVFWNISDAGQVEIRHDKSGGPLAEPFVYIGPTGQ